MIKIILRNSSAANFCLLRSILRFFTISVMLSTLFESKESFSELDEALLKVLTFKFLLFLEIETGLAERTWLVELSLLSLALAPTLILLFLATGEFY